jgi:hypothetical protein
LDNKYCQGIFLSEEGFMSSPNKTLGIMQLDTRFPRIRGDVGNRESYTFPVNIKIVSGASVQRVVMEGDPKLLSPFLDAAIELESQGAFAITTSCGFLAPFQKEISSAVKVPVFLSSLIQIPLAYQITQRRIGIITANGAALKESHLRAAGVMEDVPLAIRGLEDKPSFAGTILDDGDTIDPKQIEKEVLEAAEELLATYSDIGAFVFECHNLAPYAPAVFAATNRPVFDIISFANWMYNTVVKTEFL